MTMTLVGLRTTSGAHQPQSAWVFEVLRSLRPQASRRLSCQATPRDLWLVGRAQPGLAPEKPRNHPTTEVPNGPKHPAEPDKKGPRALSRRSGYVTPWDDATLLHGNYLSGVRSTLLSVQPLDNNSEHVQDHQWSVLLLSMSRPPHGDRSHWLLVCHWNHLASACLRITSKKSLDNSHRNIWKERKLPCQES